MTSSGLTTKAISIDKEIDTARCKGNWPAMPELARRYRKHNQVDGEILAQTILAEQILNTTLQKYQREQKWNSRVYDEDSPDRISLSPRLPAENCKSIIDMLEAAIKVNTKRQGGEIQKEFAHIILARVHFECGEYETALSVLSSTSVTAEYTHTGYGLVMHVMANVVKGTSLEQMNDVPKSLDSLDAALALVTANPLERSDELQSWIEEGLYRAALLRMRLGDFVPTVEALQSFRAYQSYASQWREYWRIHKRVTLYRCFCRFLSQCYAEGKYIPPTTMTSAMENLTPTVSVEGKVAPGTPATFTPQTFRLEITHLHALYEDGLYSITNFPKAGTLHARILEFVDQIVADWELMGGGNAHELRGLVDTLYRATTKTFNSPRIMRHLVSALVKLGEYEEAELSVKSYIALVSKKGTYASGGVDIDIDMGFKEWAEKVIIGPDGTAPNYSEDGGEAADGSIRYEEKEDDEDIIKTLLIGARLMAKEFSKSFECVRYAQMAIDVMKKGRMFKNGKFKELEARAWRFLGIGYSLLASQTSHPDKRPMYHEKALVALNQSIKLEPTSWETHYQLALQLAYMRDIDKAVTNITQALKLNSAHIPSWHLLTLLCSTPSQGSIKKALQTCEVGLKESEWEGEGAEVILLGHNSVARTASSMEEGEHALAFRLSQSALLDYTNGPDAALSMHEQLFTLYTKVFALDTASSNNSLYNGRTKGGESMAGSGSSEDVASVHNVENRQSLSAHTFRDTLNVDPLRRKQSLSAPDVKEVAMSIRSADGVLLAPSSISASLKETSNPAPASSSGVSRLLSTGKEKKPKIRKHSTGSSIGGSISGGAPMSLSLSTTSHMAPSTYAASISSQQSSRSLQSPNPTVNSSNSNMGIKSILVPSSTPTRPSTRSRFRRQRATKALSQLWLTSASAFRRQNKFDDARKAIEEAESIDGMAPDTWCQYGLLLVAEGKIGEGIVSFQKALAADPEHVTTKWALARVYLDQKEMELAEGLLESATKGIGWDSAEAWYYLGKAFQETGRVDRAKECLWYALDLEGTKPVRSFCVLPQCL